LYRAGASVRNLHDVWNLLASLTRNVLAVLTWKSLALIALFVAANLVHLNRAALLWVANTAWNVSAALTIANLVGLGGADIVGVANITGNGVANRVGAIIANLFEAGVTYPVILGMAFGFGALNLIAVAGVWHLVGAVNGFKFPMFKTQGLGGLVEVEKGSFRSGRSERR